MDRLNLHSVYQLGGSVKSLEEIIKLGICNGPELAVRFDSAKARFSELSDGKPIRLRNPDPVKKTAEGLGGVGRRGSLGGARHPGIIAFKRFTSIELQGTERSPLGNRAQHCLGK